MNIDSLFLSLKCASFTCSHTNYKTYLYICHLEATKALRNGIETDVPKKKTDTKSQRRCQSTKGHKCDTI